MGNKTCHSCKWYAEFEGVCCCGESEWCADWPPNPEEGCDKWEGGKKAWVG